MTFSDSEFPGENGNDGKNAKNANAKKAENAKDGANANEFLAAPIESHRGHLRAVAYRMLGSLSEADDAVQEAWLKLSRVDADRVDNLGGWLTTVVGRVCLDMLRSRRSRGEEPLGPLGEGPGVRMPEPVLSPVSGIDPEQEALLADSVGLALLVVLGDADARRTARLRAARPVRGHPGDRAHRGPYADGVPSARQPGPAQGPGGAPVPDPDLARQREVVDAFLAAAREGDLDALVAVLDPDVVARSEGGVTAGVIAVASEASGYAHLARIARPALVNGAAGVGGRGR